MPTYVPNSGGRTNTLIVKRYLFFAFIVCFLAATDVFSKTEVTTLKLHRLYEVYGPENFQPSGLTILNKKLYTVSDKHDQFIYYIEFSNDRATASPALKIPGLFFSPFNSYDFEGITHDATGCFYLASESYNRILKIIPESNTAKWISPDLKLYAEKTGLLQVNNAGLEGICFIPPSHFILCAERESRGFMEVNFQTTPVKVDAYQSETSRFDFPAGICKDFSGLYYFHDDVYVLERNAFVVCRMIRQDNRLVEDTAWSYGDVEKSETLRYTDMTFGKAEGLCIDDNFIYIVIDNNGMARASDSENRRPLLMVFELPNN